MGKPTATASVSPNGHVSSWPKIPSQLQPQPPKALKPQIHHPPQRSAKWQTSRSAPSGWLPDRGRYGLHAAAQLGPWPDAQCMVRPACSACVCPNLLRHRAPAPFTAPRCTCFPRWQLTTTKRLCWEVICKHLANIDILATLGFCQISAAQLAVQPAPGTPDQVEV